MTYRVGIVQYFNAKPLTWALEQGEIEGVETVLTVPSKLADQLHAGELDAALVSSIVALQRPELELLPQAGCIASDGPVQSVLLFTRVHLAQVRSVALDTSSLTSVGLVRVLLGNHYGVTPEYRPMAPDLPAMLAACDAALIIGDPGLAQYFRGQDQAVPYDVVDLGRAWREWTGLPFVFAAWIGPRGMGESGLPALLAAARERSKRAIPQIAAVAAARLGLPEEVCRYYLTEAIRYEFGAREQAGLERFRQELVESGQL